MTYPLHKTALHSLYRALYRAVGILLIVLNVGTAQAQQTNITEDPTHLFAMPRVIEKIQTVVATLSMKRFAKAEQLLIDMTNSYPWYVEGHYLLASLLAAQKKNDRALAALEAAIASGFNNQPLLYKDNNFKSLRTDKRFQALAERLIQKNAGTAKQARRQIKPASIKDGMALVSTDNTVWDTRAGLLKSYFKFNSRKVAPATVQNIKDPAAIKLNSLFQRGLAAGNSGDIYDNRDRQHSIIWPKTYPQLAHSQYSAIAQKLNIDYGLNTKIIFNAPTFGNSSTAISGGPFWRSQARLAYTVPGGPKRLFIQYLNNQLYMFPAVRDFTKTEDHLPTNTPYMIISDGKSGSDKPFLRAVATILAAFQPAEKEALARSQKLMPAVQMIFRMSQKTVRTRQDYFTTSAHPAVFKAGNIDLLKMITLANNLKAAKFPAFVQLKVLQENKPRTGIDDFSRNLPEKFFDTPAAIARVLRLSTYKKTMVVQAKSANKQTLPVTYKWVLLQGDPAKITISPLTKDGSTVEITSAWQNFSASSNGTKPKSPRIEIAVFADTGTTISAPSFITFLYPKNERRAYNKNGKILSIDHTAFGNGYVDPQVFAKRDWKDQYSYDSNGRLVGWTRSRKSGTTDFTYHGAKIIEKDALGRATKAEKIGYLYNRLKSGQMVVTEKPLNVFLNYQYSNPQDYRGILVPAQKQN